MTLPPSMVEEVVQEEIQSRKHASGVAEDARTKSGISPEMVEMAATFIAHTEGYDDFTGLKYGAKSRYRGLATGVLTAALGDKYFIVPREPTFIQQLTGQNTYEALSDDFMPVNVYDIYQAMIAASKHTG